MRRIVLVLALVVAATLPVLAQPDPGQLTAEQQRQIAEWEAFLANIDWTFEGDTGFMGDQAQIDVPPGYAFTGPQGTKELMSAFGNLISEEELGFVAPRRQPDEVDFDWFAVFEFSDSGYVKDDDKDDLDAAEMLRVMREAEIQANEERRRLGYDTLSITGWAIKPRYNESTHNLEWAMNLTSGEGGALVNLNTRLLGREGVMRVTLVCDPEDLEATIPEYQAMLRDFSFQPGHRYAEYRRGDKVAKYGLAGLVVGGGVAALAKTGLLKKLLKPILVGLLALAAFLRRIFGGGKTKTEGGEIA